MIVDGPQTLEHTRGSLQFLTRLQSFEGVKTPTLELLSHDLEMISAAVQQEIEKRRGTTVDMA